MPVQKSFRKQCAVDLSLVFTSYVFTVAILILYFRRGDWLVFYQVLAVAAHSLLMIGLTGMGWQCLSSTKAFWVLPIATMIFVTSPFLVKGLGVWSIFPVATLGFGLTLIALYNRQPQTNVKRLLLCLIAGAAIAIFYFIQVNGAGYAHIFADVAVYTSSSHPDTLFHSSIINMLAGFSTPSIGLDGIQPLAYHVGIHRWVAASQTYLQANAPFLLAVVMQVALLPALFFTWSFVLTTLGRKMVDPLITLAIGMVSLVLLGAYSWDSYLVSESYAFSLIILLAMVPVGRLWLEKSCERSKWLPVSPWQLCLAVIVIILGLMVKVSTGLVLVIFLASCIVTPQLLQQDWHSLFKYAVMSVTVLLASFSLIYVYIGSPELKWSPLHFPRSFPTEFFNEVIFAIFFLGALYVLGWRKTARKSHVLYHQALFWVLATTFIIGLLPGLTLALPAGAAYYFSHPALLVVLMLGISTLGDFYYLVCVQERLIRFRPQQLNWRLVPKRVYWGVISLFMFTMFMNWPLPPSISSPVTRSMVFWKNAIFVFTLFKDGPPAQEATARLEPWQQRFANLILFPVIDLNQLRGFTELGYVEQIIEDAELSAWDQSIVVYIDPEFEQFWSVDGSQVCWARPFEVPAIVGLPLINGVRGEGNNCNSTVYYGLGDYDSTSWNMAMSNDQLCQKARSLGFSKVLMITENDYQVLNCAD